MQTEGQGRPGARETCDLRANFRPGEGNRVVEPEFCQPPVRVLHGTAVRTTYDQKDLSPGLTKLCGDLVAGLDAAHCQHRAGRQHVGRAIGPEMNLPHRHWKIGAQDVCF